MSLKKNVGKNSRGVNFQIPVQWSNVDLLSCFPICHIMLFMLLGKQESRSYIFSPAPVYIRSPSPLKEQYSLIFCGFHSGFLIFFDPKALGETTGSKKSTPLLFFIFSEKILPKGEWGFLLPSLFYFFFPKTQRLKVSP